MENYFVLACMAYENFTWKECCSFESSINHCIYNKYSNRKVDIWQMVLVTGGNKKSNVFQGVP